MSYLLIDSLLLAYNINKDTLKNTCIRINNFLYQEDVACNRLCHVFKWRLTMICRFSIGLMLQFMS